MKHIKEMLSLYLDHCTNAEESGRIEAHLKVCPDCQAECDELRGVIQKMKSVPNEELPIGFMTRLEEKRFRLQQPFFLGGFFPKSAAFALTSAIVVVAAYTLWKEPPRHLDPQPSAIQTTDPSNSVLHKERTPIIAKVSAPSQKHSQPQTIAQTSPMPIEEIKPTTPMPAEKDATGSEMIFEHQYLSKVSEETTQPPQTPPSLQMHEEEIKPTTPMPAEKDATGLKMIFEHQYLSKVSEETTQPLQTPPSLQMHEDAILVAKKFLVRKNLSLEEKIVKQLKNERDDQPQRSRLKVLYRSAAKVSSAPNEFGSIEWKSAHLSDDLYQITVDKYVFQVNLKTKTVVGFNEASQKLLPE